MILLLYYYKIATIYQRCRGARVGETEGRQSNRLSAFLFKGVARKVWMDKKEERLAINVTVSSEEYEFVRLQAYLNKTSMSAYVRKLIDQERSKVGKKGLRFL